MVGSEVASRPGAGAGVVSGMGVLTFRVEVIRWCEVERGGERAGGWLPVPVLVVGPESPAFAPVAAGVAALAVVAGVLDVAGRFGAAVDFAGLIGDRAV